MALSWWPGLVTWWQRSAGDRHQRNRSAQTRKWRPAVEQLGDRTLMSVSSLGRALVLVHPSGRVQAQVPPPSFAEPAAGPLRDAGMPAHALALDSPGSDGLDVDPASRSLGSLECDADEVRRSFLLEARGRTTVERVAPQVELGLSGPALPARGSGQDPLEWLTAVSCLWASGESVSAGALVRLDTWGESASSGETMVARAAGPYGEPFLSPVSGLGTTQPGDGFVVPSFLAGWAPAPEEAGPPALACSDRAVTEFVVGLGPAPSEVGVAGPRETGGDETPHLIGQAPETGGPLRDDSSYVVLASPGADSEDGTPGAALVDVRDVRRNLLGNSRVSAELQPPGQEPPAIGTPWLLILSSACAVHLLARENPVSGQTRALC
jgi:hypothetical protein